MNSRAGLFSFGFKVILLLIALLLIAYGYYGYIYVPSKSMGPFGPPCPFGREGSTSFFGITMGTGPCSYARTSLIFGLVVIAVLVVLFLLPKRKKKK